MHSNCFKNKLPGLLIFLLGFTSLFGQSQTDKDKDAIKAVIIKETSSFMNVDRNGWAASWVHAPYSYWSYADSAGSNFMTGWDAIDKTYDTYFKTAKPSKAKITDEWLELRVYGNGAYARFIQKSVDNFDVDETSQVRVLEKKDGRWKVVHVGVVVIYPSRKGK